MTKTIKKFVLYHIEFGEEGIFKTLEEVEEEISSGIKYDNRNKEDYSIETLEFDEVDEIGRRLAEEDLKNTNNLI